MYACILPDLAVSLHCTLFDLSEGDIGGFTVFALSCLKVDFHCCVIFTCGYARFVTVNL